VFPFPTPVLGTRELDPGSKSQLTLGDLGVLVFADLVYATGAVVGGDLCGGWVSSLIAPKCMIPSSPRLLRLSLGYGRFRAKEIWTKGNWIEGKASTNTIRHLDNYPLCSGAGGSR
jgi:hypothetical protein